MQIYADRLADQLQRELRAVYTVWGDEPLLAQEAADAIRAAARAAGCSERQVHTVAGAHFDWSSLLGASQALSEYANIKKPPTSASSAAAMRKSTPIPRLASLPKTTSSYVASRSPIARTCRAPSK